MSQPSKPIHTCAPPPHHPHTWRRLVQRSQTAWDAIIARHPTVAVAKGIATAALSICASLDAFLDEYKVPYSLFPMFWFFQERSSFLAQARLPKWSRENLDDYVLLPALPGFVWRADCFFVSHYWQSPQHPDPDGTYLRLHQDELRAQSWAYIWVDWSCMPQAPRTANEDAYFTRCLRNVSAIIRNCGFAYFYPPFEPRLWILYEIAEYVFTCDEGLVTTPDLQGFLDHVYEMRDKGVRATLRKYKYRCGSEKDWEFLVPWLELLVLMRTLPFDVGFVRKVMDDVTWFDVSGVQFYGGIVEIDRYKGVLKFEGKEWGFTPFPRWRTEGLEAS